MSLIEQFLLFDKYKVVRKIKTTNTYTMYIGAHTQTNEYVLIQALNTIAVTHYDSDRGRFLSELKAVRGFDHSNILHVLDSGIVDDTICIVYEYFEGISLNTYLNEHKNIGITMALRIITQIALALRYASDYGILHRSLCASSILIEQKGGNYQVKLYGYGMYFILDYTNLPDLDVDKTYGYMAPEITGVLDRDIDIRSDLYSLGVIFYRLLTGTLPFHAAMKDNMVYKHLAQIPKSPELVDPSIPSEVSNIVTKLLSKDPSQRYSTPNELISDIDRYLCNNELISDDSDRDVLHDFDRRATVYARSRELSALKDVYDKTMNSGKGHFCVVHGGLGCGKTDLSSNLCHDLRALGITCLRSSFKAQYLTTPYHAFQNLLNDYVAIYRDYDHKKQVIEKNRLSTILSGLTGIITRICPLMDHVLTESLSMPLPDEYKEELRTMQLLSDFMLSLFQSEKPYVIILDDLHNADASSLALLSSLAENISNHNVLIVCTMRDQTEEDKNNLLASTVSRISETEGYVDVQLTAFNTIRMCEFLSDLLDLPRQECNVLTNYMLKKTEGNPYFTVNILRSMLEDKVITINNRVLEQDWDKLRSFNTRNDIIDIITSRIHMLDDDAITLLEIASVIGCDFSLELLAYITDLKVSDLMPWIEKAIMMQFLNYSSAQNILSFAHKQIHEVFNARLTEDHKKELHYWIARGIESMYANNLHNEVYRLVYHFMMADYDAGVKKYCIAAADLANQSNAKEEAIQYYRRAIELMDDREIGKTVWIKAKRALTNLSLVCGYYDEAISNAHTLLPYLENDILEQATLLRNIGLGYFKQNKVTDAIDSLLEALNVLKIDNTSKLPIAIQIRKMRFKANRSDFNFNETGSNKNSGNAQGMRNTDGKDLEIEKTVCSIYSLICWIYAFVDKQKMNFYLLKMNEYASEHFGTSPELALGKSCLSAYYFFNGEKDRFRKVHSYAAHIRRSLGDKFGIGRSLFVNGLFTQFYDDIPASIKSLNESYNVYEKIGDISECNTINLYLSRSYYLLADYDNCIDTVEKTISVSKKIGDDFTLCMAYSIKIAMLCRRGHFMYAIQTEHECRKIVNQLNLPFVKCFFELCCGILSLESTKYEDAVRHLTTAVDILEQNSFVDALVLTAYSKLAMAKFKILIEKKSQLSVTDTARTQAEIVSLCNKAIKISKNNSRALADAYSATAMYNASVQKTKSTNELYVNAIELSDLTGDQFETAKLHMDYGVFLMNQHRSDSARFHLFEASMVFSAIGSEEYAKACKDILLNKFSKDITEGSILADVAEKRNRLTTDRKINALLKFGERLTSTLEMNELQNKILQDTVEMLGAERGILFLYPEAGEKILRIAALYNIDTMDSKAYDWILARVEQTKQPVIINDITSAEYKRYYSNLIRFNIKSVMAMPMFVRGKLFGVIYLDSRILRDIFNSEFMETMSFIANQCGAPIENARLYHRAITDGLTGLYGRSYFDNLIIDKTSDPKNAKLSALMLDIDLFKKCNDTYGHQFGDKVLKQVAEIAKRASAPMATACRYGGEEFVIIVDSDDVNIALDIGERIRSEVAATSVPFNEEGKVTLVSITLSIGVSVWDESMERVELIERADKALYYAKHNGKNQVVLWNPDIK